MKALELAEMVGITRAGISAYERGLHSPGPDVFDKIVDVLRFKPEFFLRPAEHFAEQAIFERSRVRATWATRLRARHRRTWLREILQHLTQYVKVPASNIPEIGHPLGWEGLSDAQIESLAKDLRRHWSLGDGPISNVTLLAENNGIVVTLIPMKANKLDAFSLWDEADGRPYIVLGDDSQSAFRTRFNVCHEIGHLLLHRGLSDDVLQDKANHKLVESQADRFAASFLTPATAFSPEALPPTLERFRLLKPRWRTSIKMMIHRAEELDVIDREEARRLYISYNRRGWNTQEPLDTEAETEEPRLVRRLFEAVIEGSVLLPSQITAALPFNPEDMEQLANLPYGYLDEASVYNWAIRELNAGFQGKSDNFGSSAGPRDTGI